MYYLRGFIPWIASGVIASFDLRWGSLAGLLTGLLLLAQDRRRGVPLDSEVLEISSIGYFFVMAILATVFPHSGLSTYDDVISFGWLAVTAWGSIVIGQPFTLGIARRQTPEEYWHVPGFLKVNVVIAAVWGAGFTFIGAALLVCHAIGAGTSAQITAHVIGLVVPAVFTKRYPERAKARMLAAAGAAGGTEPASASRTA